MKRVNKISKVLEKFWLVIAIIATVFSLVISIEDNFQGVMIYFLLSGLAWGIYLIRRGLRVRLEKIAASSNGKAKKK